MPPSHSKPDFTPSYKRRARHHDYYSACSYHVTICKLKTAPTFGCLKGDCRIKVGTPGCAYVELNDLGKIIAEEIITIQHFHPIVQIYQYSVMPDHIHILLRITQRSPKALGYYISNFMGAVRRRWRDATNNGYKIFEKGYNDKIIYRDRSLATVFNYIRENPHRLAVRRMYPEFFKRVYNVTIGGKKYQTYGNQFLLRNPFKEQVVVHRADGVEVRERMREMWLYAAANGGVLVSPFISPAEKEIRAAAEEMDGRVILITHMPFGERYKPHAHDFDLCCRGLLLIVAPTEPPVSDELSRTACLTMNALAATICDDGQ